MKEKSKNILSLLVTISVALSIATVVVCTRILDYYDFLYLYIYVALAAFLITMAFSYKKGNDNLLKISFISFLTGSFFIRTDNFVGAIENVSSSMLSLPIKNGIIALVILTFAFFIFPFINYYIMNATLKSKISTTKENKLLIGIDMVFCAIYLVVIIVVKDIYLDIDDMIVAILTLINMIVMLYIFMLIEDVTIK